MQNTNFKNTYTLEQTPPTNRTPPTNGLPPKHPKGGTSTITKKPSSTATYNQLSTPLSTRNGEQGVSQYKPKTTSFSRIKRNIVSDAATPNSSSNYSVTSTSRTPNVSQYGSIRTRELHKNQKPSEKRKMSGSPHLLAALEYSDHSSDEGSGHVGNGYRSDKNRGRHLTQVLNDESTNGYERFVYLFVVVINPSA